jgi:hypothetical protein
MKNSYQRKANYVGTPTTWVFAKARTSQAVVDILTNGRVSVSANPYAPRVEFYADLDQDGKMDVMMGDNAKSTGKPVNFRVQLAGNTVSGASYTVRVVKDGNPFSSPEGNRWQDDHGRVHRHPGSIWPDLLPHRG